MFCSFCGKEIFEEAQYCMYCGKKVNLLYIQNNDEIEVVDKNSESLNQENSAQENSLIISKRNSIYSDNTTKNYLIPSELGYFEFLSEEKVNYFKRKYFKNGKFHFPISDSEVIFEEDVIMDINTQNYFLYISDKVCDYFVEEYENKVRTMDDLFTEGFIVYTNSIKMAVDLLMKLLIASNIMTVSRFDITHNMKMTEELIEAMNKLYSRCIKISEEFEQNKMIREYQRSLSTGNSFVGGFGFMGVLGGALASGILNTGASIVESISNSMANAREKRMFLSKISELFDSIDFIEIFQKDLKVQIERLLKLYIKLCNDEFQIQYNDYGDDSLLNIAKNILEYGSSHPETLVSDMCKVISSNPCANLPLLLLSEEMVNNKEMRHQMLELSEFLMKKEILVNFFEKYVNEKLEEIRKMPIKTVEEIEKKIKKLEDEGKNLEYMMVEKDIEFLEAEKKRIIETERQKQLKEEEAKEKEKNRYRKRDIHTESAKSALAHIEKNEINEVGYMAAKGSLVAQELYIQYYIDKIKYENNNRLFDTIAAHCGKNPAYDCIVGICCIKGYGTKQEINLGIALLEHSALNNNPYATVYLNELLVNDELLLDSKDNEKIIILNAKKLLDELSPLACFYEARNIFKNPNLSNEERKLANFYNDYSKDCGVHSIDE